MSDDKKSFTVSDRRHFTAEGRARETEPASPPAPPEPRSAPSATEGSGLDGEAGPDGEEDLPPFPADLLGLIVSLTTQASVLLGGDPSVPRPPTPPEREAVRSIIGLLDVLHEKTANNRTPEEERVLDAARYQLKMAFVARTRAGGA
jgi:uncharacterized protein DUF1844